VSLRSVSSDNFVVVDQTAEHQVIAETDFTSALSMLHPKAIYIVEGRLFQVEQLDFGAARRTSGPWTAITTPPPSTTRR
jgi:DEAD/DEAH box helicase domain-containing protein